MSAKSPAAERLRPTPWDALVAVLVAAAGVLLLLGLRPSGDGALTAQVVLDGETVAQYRLDQITEPVRLELDAPYPLVVEVEPGRIRIAESTCPGGDCVHTGWVSRAGGRIICLPNRLVISVTGGGEDSREFDAVTG